MYQADFICTYKDMDSPEDQEMLYQIQILQAFDLQEWDDEKVKITIEELYNELKTDVMLPVILEKISKVEALQVVIEMSQQQTKEEKDLLYFSLLFQFDYFDLFHNCIIDFKHRGGIREKTITTF